MAQMEEFRVKQSNGVTITFRGELLANVTSFDPNNEAQQRWMDLRIFRTSEGNYVVEDIGRSNVQWEQDRIKVRICKSVSDVAAALRRRANRQTLDPNVRNVQYYFTDLVLHAFADATKKDPAFKDAASVTA